MADIYITDSKNVIYPVITGDLLLPKFGNWSSHINFGGTEVVPSGKVVLHWYDTDWHGYVIRSGIQNAVGTAVLVGGNGGLWRDNPVKMYDFTVAASLPIKEILADCGESLSITSDIKKLNQSVPNWIRRSAEAGQQLSDLCYSIDCIWSVLPDGSVYIGNYDYPSILTDNVTLINHDPTLLYSDFNALTTAIRPGQKITVLKTDYKIVAAHYRAEKHRANQLCLWYSDPQKTTSLDPLKSGMAQFVREIFWRADFYASYDAKVVLQRANGTLDVVFDSNRFPPLSSVPVALPWPNAKINVSPNDRVIVKFREGDPTKFVAELYTSKKGGKPIARKGDSVDCGSLVLKFAAGVLSATYTPPGGISQEGTTIALKGAISSGSSVIEDS